MPQSLSTKLGTQVNYLNRASRESCKERIVGFLCQIRKPETKQLAKINTYKAVTAEWNPCLSGALGCAAGHRLGLRPFRWTPWWAKTRPWGSLRTSLGGVARKEGGPHRQCLCFWEKVLSKAELLTTKWHEGALWGDKIILCLIEMVDTWYRHCHNSPNGELI